jgi:hypothetical protein
LLKNENKSVCAILLHCFGVTLQKGYHQVARLVITQGKKGRNAVVLRKKYNHSSTPAPFKKNEKKAGTKVQN